MNLEVQLTCTCDQILCTQQEWIKDASSFVWLSVSLKWGLEVLKSRTIVKSSWEENFGALMQNSGSKFSRNCIKNCNSRIGDFH